jgi:hypothetical protein
MFKVITWGNYITAAALLLACYYAVVFLLFYRAEIQNFITSLKNRKSSGNSDPLPVQEAQFEQLESIVHEIDSILESAGKTATKDQLLPQLNQKLANYGGLRSPAYRVAVFNHIIKQADEICGVRVTEQDLEQVG